MWAKTKKFWGSLGSGLITGVADNDTSAVLTYTMAGALYGSYQAIQAVVDDLTKMAGVYSKDIVSSMTTVPVPQRQILLEVKFAELDRTRLEQLGINIFSTGATVTGVNG